MSMLGFGWEVLSKSQRRGKKREGVLARIEWGEVDVEITDVLPKLGDFGDNLGRVILKALNLSGEGVERPRAVRAIWDPLP